MIPLEKTGEFIPDFIDRDLLFAALTVIIVLLLLMGIIYPILEARERAKNRTMAIGSRSPSTIVQDSRSAAELQKRRKIITESLQEVASLNEKKKRLNLDVRIAQAGLEITPILFIGIFIGSGILFGFVFYRVTDNQLLAAGIAITLIFGAPNWILNYLRNRRIGKFILKEALNNNRYS
jgi:tight adherence protein B